MTEIELNEKIENLLTESAPGQPSRRTGSAYRREMRIRKNDALMRIVTRRYVPHAGYIDYGFDGDTLLHSGKYIKYPKKCFGVFHRSCNNLEQLQKRFHQDQKRPPK